MSHTEHQTRAEGTPVRCAVLTISDTRTPETDRSGALMQTLLREADYEIADYRIARDEPAQIRPVLEAWAGTVDAILTNGGTGIARRDTTIEVARALIETPLPGFGELFRMLSYEEIGAAAMLSRAEAGVMAGRTLLFCTPGSTNAVRLAMEKLIVPELAHLAWELRRTG